MDRWWFPVIRVFEAEVQVVSEADLMGGQNGSKTFSAWRLTPRARGQ